MRVCARAGTEVQLEQCTGLVVEEGEADSTQGGGGGHWPGCWCGFHGDTDAPGTSGNHCRAGVLVMADRV